MKARYSERILANSPATITVGSQVSEGRVLDLTVPGCLIESLVSVKKGDSLQLKLFLAGLTSPLTVTLGAVRWANGFQFGVEFIKMDEKDQRELNQVMARRQSNLALKKEGSHHQFSDSGGLNWHLATYSSSEETQA
jgi:hypothetical protein